jgi:hypothetical protein
MALLLGVNTMDDKSKMAFEFARDSVRQLITLATGIIALAITFSKDFIGTIPPSAKHLAELSWGAFLLSVLFGLWSLLALTGTLGIDAPSTPSIRERNVTLPATLQIVSFFAGLVLTVVFGILAV